jgi:hypothetical protein
MRCASMISHSDGSDECHAGDIVWAHEELEEMLGSQTEIVVSTRHIMVLRAKYGIENGQ